MSKQAVLEAVQGWSYDDWREVLLHAPDLADRLRKVMGFAPNDGVPAVTRQWMELTGDDRRIIADDYPQLAEALDAMSRMYFDNLIEGGKKKTLLEMDEFWLWARQSDR